MPGWLTVRDRDGTVFFLDPAMKLHPANDPDKKYKTVAKENLGFLFAEADELMRIHRKADALRIYKSVRYLASLDSAISITGGKATEKIRAVASREKDRFPAYDLDSAILLVRQGAVTRARNESAGFTLTAGGAVTLIKRTLSGSNGYMLDAAMFGVSASSGGSGFDAVVTVSAESFRNSFDFIEKYEELVRNKTPGDNFTREKISSTPRTALYRYEGGAPAVYAGYEKLCAFGQRCFVVRSFAPKESASGEALAKKLIDSFEIGGTQ